MARLQILELPSEVYGEDVATPFALILDETEGEQVQENSLIEFGRLIGAKGVAVFGNTVTIPANQ